MLPRSEVPEEITRLRERVERWRRTRRGHGPMPAELWAEAVAIARKHGLYETARGVGIDYGALAKRMRNEPRHLEAERSVAVEFVEWTGAEVLGQVAASTGAVVEMSDPGGRQVIVRVGAGERVDIPGIVAAFCGGGRR